MLSQKELKREIFSQKEKLKDHELFVSDSYNKFLTQMQDGITECKSGCEAFITENTESIAYTDGTRIYISYDSLLSKGHNRKERHLIYCGLNLHECGHLLFTDFQLMMKSMEALKKGEMYPTPEDNPYLQKLRNFLYTTGNEQYILPIFKKLDNCIEDGFVDRAVMAMVPGYARCLRYVRNEDNSLEKMTYKEMVDKKCPRVHIFIAMTLFYARHGLLLFDDSDSGELIDSFKEVMPVIKKAVFSASPFQRKKMVWKVMCYLYNFIEIDNNQQKKNSQNGAQQGNNSQNGAQQGNNSQSGTQQGNNSQSGTQQGNSSQSGTQQGNNSQNGAQQGNNSQSGTQQGNSTQSGTQQGNNSQSGTQQGNSSQSGAQQGNNSQGDAQQGNGSVCGESPQSIQEALKQADAAMRNTESTKHNNTVTPNEKVMSALENKLNSASGKSSEEKKADETGNLECSELDSIANKVAEGKIFQKQEDEIKKDMSQKVTSYLSDAPIHRGIHAKCTRAGVTERATSSYEKEHRELDSIVTRMITEFEKEIKERQTGDTLTGLYTGKRFEAREAYRYDKRVMSRKILPEDIPDMAVGILVDCSGSMGGDKIHYAIQSAYITYSFCKRLQIPVFVVGHTTSGNDVSLISVADENSLDNNDKIRIFDLRSQNCNRDGYALKYCMEKLKHIVAEQKLMMIISDGCPNHTDYHLNEGRADCQAIVKDGIKNGITTIAAAIDDAVNVQSVYKKGISEKNSAEYLDLSDLRKLPKAFVKIIKKRLS